MTEPPDPASRRAIRHQLAEASETQLAQVVALVDRMPERGEAEALIAPLRPRLARLRPPRPPSFRRLLFLPLDGVLANAADWRRGMLGIPRTALRPLAELVQQGADPGCAPDGDSDGNPDGGPGAILWPRAAAILQAADTPADWRSQTGLPDTDFPAIAATAALVLSQAGWILASASGAAEPPDVPARTAARLAALLAQDFGEAASACLFVVVADRLSDSEARLDAIEAAAARVARPGIRRARARAHGAMLQQMLTPSHLAGDLGQAARRVGRDARLLDALSPTAAQAAGIDPEAARQSLDARCRQRFSIAVEADLAIPAATPELGGIEDAPMLALEAAARSLRLFAKAAQRVGSRDFYEQALTEAARRLHVQHFGGLSRADRLRLTEWLLGSAAARDYCR